MPSNQINLAIVSDHAMSRKILKYYIADQKNIFISVESPDIPDLMQKIKDSPIEMLVVDQFVPRLSSIVDIEIIRSEYPDIKILILSICSDMELLYELLDLGVYGILSSNDEPEELVRAIITSPGQRIHRSKLLTELMYWSKQQKIKINTDIPISLSKREEEILQLLWEEKSNKEIASHLFLSVRSVEKIRQDMKEKIGAKSTVGLLKYAINKKIININPRPLNGLYSREKQSARPD